MAGEDDVFVGELVPRCPASKRLEELVIHNLPPSPAIRVWCVLEADHVGAWHGGWYGGSWVEWSDA